MFNPIFSPYSSDSRDSYDSDQSQRIENAVQQTLETIKPVADSMRRKAMPRHFSNFKPSPSGSDERKIPLRVISSVDEHRPLQNANGVYVVDKPSRENSENSENPKA